MEKRVRKEIRLCDFDYSRDGAYFITICTKDRQCLFWENKDKYKPFSEENDGIPDVGAAFRRPQDSGKIYLSEYGKAAADELKRIPSIYPGIVFIPKYVIMPNHIHLIIVISSVSEGGRRNAAPTISRVMNQFKGSVSRRSGFSVWQRSFYDRVIRSRYEYAAFVRYIEANPVNWQKDEYYVG